MRISGFRQRVLSGEILAGTFMKTPWHEVLEVLAKSGLDFVCLDTEHGPMGRTELDACLAVARALDFPVLVRVATASPEYILQALDMGAVGVVVPHVFSAERAEAVARAAHFGHAGRGMAGWTRWAGHGGRSFAELRAQSRDETLVLAQIEEPEGVDAAAAIAAVDGIDGLFIGPADLSVSYGHDTTDNDDLRAAFQTVGEAARANGKALVTFVPSAAEADALKKAGVTMFFIGSDQGLMRGAAAAQAARLKSVEV